MKELMKLYQTGIKRSTILSTNLSVGFSSFFFLCPSPSPLTRLHLCKMFVLVFPKNTALSQDVLIVNVKGRQGRYCWLRSAISSKCSKIMPLMLIIFQFKHHLWFQIIKDIYFLRIHLGKYMYVPQIDIFLLTENTIKKRWLAPNNF